MQSPPHSDGRALVGIVRNPKFKGERFEALAFPEAVQTGLLEPACKLVDKQLDEGDAFVRSATRTISSISRFF
jgi:hypothetical protein